MNESTILPALQQVLSILWEKECERENITPSQAHCLVDRELLTGARIEPGTVPVVRVSAEWMQTLAFDKRTGELIRALRRAVLNLHHFTRTLSNPATRAALYLESARTFRFTHPDSFTLPERHFGLTFSFTLTCPLTKETETVSNVTHNSLNEELQNARHRLTARVFQHEQIADLLDQLEAVRLAREGPAEEPIAMRITTHDAHTVMSLEYSNGLTDIEAFPAQPEAPHVLTIIEEEEEGPDDLDGQDLRDAEAMDNEEQDND